MNGVRRKAGLSLAGMALFFLLSLCFSSGASAHGSIGFARIRADLTPYGSWFSLAPYGVVWRPHAVYAGWRPYSHGHWYWGPHGWTWRSHWVWGALPFHYGRWVFAGNVGWIWVPMLVWSPAWVVWYTTDQYVGWAPLGPAGPPPVILYGHWSVIPARAFLAPRIRPVLLPVKKVRVVYKTVRVSRDAVVGIRPAPRRTPPRRSWIIARSDPRYTRGARVGMDRVHKRFAVSHGVSPQGYRTGAKVRRERSGRSPVTTQGIARRIHTERASARAARLGYRPAKSHALVRGLKRKEAVPRVSRRQKPSMKTMGKSAVRRAHQAGKQKRAGMAERAMLVQR